MRTIETSLAVNGSHQAIIQLPDDILPGEHHAVIMLDPEGEKKTKKGRFDDFPVDSWGEWPASISLRREDMYDDNGR